MDESTPAFAVVPKSRRCSNIQELRRKLGAEYTEVPILGPAGTWRVAVGETVILLISPLQLH